ncbi:hypothetical protein HMN09_01199700 [Mycena chlorophos]|uniref:F-box domain-containing protein n=1 Tax=Mycena chlorophos TaxID=658473 RepID=A0A8H6S8G6_MYCCL|nr:hypothetical protein HMN09_01199700 [Mycena chlorophos]
MPEAEQRAGLLSLPNELLIPVFENPSFPTEYLCLLATLSRRLHFVALPIYFRRHGMPDPSKYASFTLTNDGQDMLAALNMALYLTSIEEIHCVFPHPSCSSILPLIPHVKRVTNFISRFPSVKRVSLQLDAQNSQCNSAGDDAAVRAWSLAFGRLLNTLSKRRCTELTVRYGAYLTRTFVLSSAKLPKPMKRAIRAVKRALRRTIGGKDWEFQRVAEQGRERIPALAAPRSSKLTTLHIHSGVLVTPPCLPWTLSVLRTSPVVSLSLAEITLDKGYWRPVLKLLAKAAGPTLTSVSLCKLDNISDEEIFGFLRRLPRLKSLEIGSVNEKQGLPTHWTARPTRLPNLVSLIAPPELVLHFVQAKPTVLPNLKALCIAFDASTMKTHIRFVATHLAAISEALGTVNTPAITLALVLFSQEIIFDLDALPLMPNQLKDALARVGSLDLDVFPRSSPDVARWVRAVFGVAVDRVALTVRAPVKGALTEPVHLEWVEAFKGSDVKNVVVNGELYDLTKTAPATTEA